MKRAINRMRVKFSTLSAASGSLVMDVYTLYYRMYDYQTLSTRSVAGTSFAETLVAFLARRAFLRLRPSSP